MNFRQNIVYSLRIVSFLNVILLVFVTPWVAEYVSSYSKLWWYVWYPIVFLFPIMIYAGNAQDDEANKHKPVECSTACLFSLLSIQLPMLLIVPIISGNKDAVIISSLANFIVEAGDFLFPIVRRISDFENMPVSKDQIFKAKFVNSVSTFSVIYVFLLLLLAMIKNPNLNLEVKQADNEQKPSDSVWLVIGILIFPLFIAASFYEAWFGAIPNVCSEDQLYYFTHLECSIDDDLLILMNAVWVSATSLLLIAMIVLVLSKFVVFFASLRAHK